MRDLIQGFKYWDRHEGLPLFGRWLATTGAELLVDADLIVPFPPLPLKALVAALQSVGRTCSRRGRLTGVPIDCLLLGRMRRPPSQVGLTAAQRRRNVAGAFRVTRARIHLRGKRIVVVDDVITTGATVDACARTLKRAGAVRVDILALARAVEPSAFLL
jgi:predicted amidophosphoribosyltransferase